MAATVRAFLAFEIPDGVRERLTESVAGLRRRMPRARWTRPEAWHLTLKFLGESDPALLAALASDLGRRLVGSGPAVARLSGSGFFPNPARPRVAWLGGGVEGSGPVLAVVEEVAEAAGFERERRPWSVHLTLARIQSRWPRDAIEQFLQWGEGVDLGSFSCPEVVLYRSTLQPGGAVYTALERIGLE